MSKSSPYRVFQCINMHAGDKTVCWEWLNKVNKKDGRPYITIQGKRRPAYAVVLELHSGELQKEQLAIHSCDNPICCNPYHLRWATHQDNMDDMVKRERHGLNKTVVRAIRKLRAAGRTQQEVSKLYGVSREAISAIDTGRSH